MSPVAVAVLLAAVIFILTMVFLRSGQPWAYAATGVTGAAYHFLLLPAVAELPAPAWAKAAGYGWLLLDAAIGGAQVAKLNPEITNQLRSGAHLPAAVWVAAAGLSGTWWLAVIGVLFAIMQAGSTVLINTKLLGPWTFWAQAGLNVTWMAAVAVTLA